MSRILIVGNVVRDIYLKLDERTLKIERDEIGGEWLDLKFGGMKMPYFKETELLGGAVVTAEVLRRLGHEVEIAGTKITGTGQNNWLARENEIDHRYILSTNNGVVYLSPNQRPIAKFQLPKQAVDYILIDRTANIDQGTVREVLAYLAMSTETKLIVVKSKWSNLKTCELCKRADLIFDEGILKTKDERVCKITADGIFYRQEQEYYHHNKAQLMTDLTLRNIIIGTIVGAAISGVEMATAIKMAKINVENAGLNKVLSKTELEERLKIEQDTSNMEMIAKSLLASGKGILAADESGGSIEKKFARLGIYDTETLRRDYRQMLLTTPGLEKYVNGVILFDETARQETREGEGFIELLTRRGIIPGVKVDQGLGLIEGTKEKYTKGLEGLTGRLKEYHEMGLRFAKWRAAFEVGEGRPSEMAIAKNCEILAEYAKRCQSAQIVPIVEPELVHEGNYDIKACGEITERILRNLIAELKRRGVNLGACILKCNMVLAGSQVEQSTAEEVGQATAKTLKAVLPNELAGVVFLSGGQTPEQATKNLAAISQAGEKPWPITFSFARALQEPALEVWRGDNNKIENAQAKLIERLAANQAAIMLKDMPLA